MQDLACVKSDSSQNRHQRKDLTNALQVWKDRAHVILRQAAVNAVWRQTHVQAYANQSVFLCVHEGVLP